MPFSVAGARPSGPPQSGVRDAQVAQAIREAVGAFANHTVAEELIHEALVEAQLPNLPDGADVLRAFVEVELRGVILTALGEDVADAVVAELGPMITVLERIDARRATGPRTVPPPGTPALAHARTAIVTGDARLAVRVRVALGGGSDLVRYERFSDLAARGRVHSSVIVDCRGLAVASLHEAGVCLARTDVLLLFASVSERTTLRGLCPTAGAIVCVSRDVDDAELPTVLGSFLGTR